MRNLFLIALSAAVLSACSLAPRYERPEAPIAGQWPQKIAGDSQEELQSGVVKAASPMQNMTINGTVQIAKKDSATSVSNVAADIPWHDFFTDSQLQKIIAAALENNRDLRIAILNVQKAQDQYRIRRDIFLPSIDGSAFASRQRTPASISPTGAAEVGNEFHVGLGAAAFEIDLFGHLQSLKDAALAQYLGLEESRKAAQISLIAAVATAYFTQRADQDSYDLAQANSKSATSFYELVKQRFDVGTASAIDLYQAETQRETARTALSQREQQLAQDKNLLTLLVGDKTLNVLPEAQFNPQAITVNLPAGLPSDLLMHRPDILAAEQQLKAANANIGAARAAFFPTITLTGSFGTSSSALNGLFKTGSSAWDVMPNISLPIFDAGRNWANLDAVKTDQKIAVAQYEKTIQTAFREVADALAARAALTEQANAQQALIDAASNNYALIGQRYQLGAANELDYQTAQQQFNTMKQNQIQVDLARLNNWVSLYKALGGGLK